MEKRLDLTKGPIAPVILKLSLPIFITAFLQMAYNLVDMIWISKLGYKALGAVGTAGYYFGFEGGFALLAKVGAQIGVSHSLGHNDEKMAKSYARSAIHLAMMLGIVVSFILIVFAKPLILFFHMPTPIVNEWASSYLRIIAYTSTCFFIQMAITGIYTGSADSKTPLYINLVGLAINMTLDPIMIFGYFGFKKMGIEGAAWATTISQFIVFFIFLIHFKSKKSPLKGIKILKKPDFLLIKKIITYGYPVSLQSITFTIFSMILARALTTYGDIAISVQKVGTQIESISWLTAEGFQSAICAFIGQNYGAKNYERIKDGYFVGLKIVSSIGFFASVLFILFPEQLFSIFANNDQDMLREGVNYLKIISISELFMVIEISTAGAFNGMGRTTPPSLVSFVFTGLRIPFAFLFVYLKYPLSSMWFIISITAILKGIFTGLWFPIWFNKEYKLKMGKSIFVRK